MDGQSLTAWTRPDDEDCGDSDDDSEDDDSEDGDAEPPKKKQKTGKKSA